MADFKARWAQVEYKRMGGGEPLPVYYVIGEVDDSHARALLKMRLGLDSEPISLGPELNDEAIRKSGVQKGGIKQWHPAWPW